MAKSGMNWKCPHCFHPQVLTDNNSDVKEGYLYEGFRQIDQRGYQIISIRCLNEECAKRSLEFILYDLTHNPRGSDYFKDQTNYWKLLPENTAKPQPLYIPDVLRDDYIEACRIRDLSPKASATLARRCLQGMIRDFAGIAKGRLIDEIKELRARTEAGSAPRGVEPETIDAIDAVRDIGNIGAHMEKDINIIVDVDPGEAQALIELIELLFDEWYVARHKRQGKLAAITALAAKKKDELAVAKAARQEVISTAEAPKKIAAPETSGS
ncbi:DUF4145 domain-containing protein [Aureimonas psammosilenae]|uniref:DUF4145 domain-containing protein n=1 Tax=Aureimonas psammosilenae TaxID=2495496 RepID=UPI001F479672|nr:DUF4145 domain-containing protein [Aureimonas psammosilenae]